MSEHPRSIACMACHGTGVVMHSHYYGQLSRPSACEYCGGTGREVQPPLGVCREVVGRSPQLEWTTRPLERPYLTQDGDEIQLRVDGIAIWRHGRMVEVIKYKEHA